MHLIMILPNCKQPGHPRYQDASFGCTFEVSAPKNVDLMHNKNYGRPKPVLGSTF